MLLANLTSSGQSEKRVYLLKYFFKANPIPLKTGKPFHSNEVLLLYIILMNQNVCDTSTGDLALSSLLLKGFKIPK